jgi:hypothetical protein
MVVSSGKSESLQNDDDDVGGQPRRPRFTGAVCVCSLGRVCLRNVGICTDFGQFFENKPIIYSSSLLMKMASLCLVSKKMVRTVHG